MLKIGIIREGKVPHDSRVALSPRQCKRVMDTFGVKVLVEPSPIRCFSDQEYLDAGIEVSKDMASCDILIGIKEVPIEQLLPNKTYFFFSHTIKKQAHNRKLLQAILEKNIRLIDYEVIKDTSNNRLIAFGKFAGIAGAHDGMMAYGLQTNTFELPQTNTFRKLDEAIEFYKTLEFPKMKICITGTGRVASGANETMENMGIKYVSPTDYLANDYECAVFTILPSERYVKKKSDGGYDQQEFYAHGDRYETNFTQYIPHTDLFINCIFWEPKSPQFFNIEDISNSSFRISTIADVTCDIAPESSVPTTIRASTIANAVYGIDKDSHSEVAAYSANSIAVMAIDNLPSELPLDASVFFGEQMIDEVLPALLQNDSEGVVERATIAKDGQLMPLFEYLSDYVLEKV